MHDNKLVIDGSIIYTNLTTMRRNIKYITIQLE